MRVCVLISSLFCFFISVWCEKGQTGQLASKFSSLPPSPVVFWQAYVFDSTWCSSLFGQIWTRHIVICCFFFFLFIMFLHNVCFRVCVCPDWMCVTCPWLTTQPSPSLKLCWLAASQCCTFTMPSSAAGLYSHWVWCTLAQHTTTTQDLVCLLNESVEKTYVIQAHVTVCMWVWVDGFLFVSCGQQDQILACDPLCRSGHGLEA